MNRMPRFDPKTQERWLAEGRGQGKGIDYVPWVEVHHFGSRGQANRVRGVKVPRTHHFHSLSELHYFYTLEWNPMVLDIREQYPLLPPTEPCRIAKEIGVRPPIFPGSGEPMVITTDFLITVQGPGGRLMDIARSIKRSEDLERPSVLRRLEIERRYFQELRMDWRLVTERDISKELAENVNWVRMFMKVETLSVSPAEVSDISAALKGMLDRDRGLALRDAARMCEDRLGYEVGTVLPVVRHLIASRQWLVDMNRRIDPSEPLVVLGVHPSGVRNEDENRGLAG